MAGATNRAFKAAGIPRATVKQLRVVGGAGMTLRSAISLAEKHGLDVPQKAHDFAAQRDRKAALKTAKARRAANLTRAIGDASRISMGMRRKAAEDARKATAALDSAGARPKVAGVDTKPRKVGRNEYEATIGDVTVKIVKGQAGYRHDGTWSKATEWKVYGGGKGRLAEGHGTMSGALAEARRKLGAPEPSQGAPTARSVAAMKHGQSVQVGDVTVTKTVTRTAVAQRDDAGTKIGRRHFSNVTYHVTRKNGSYIDIVRRPDEALSLAQERQ